MPDLKRYSIGLLLTGIGLTLGSCVPLAQTLWSGSSGVAQRLAPGGEPAVLVLARDLTAVPIVSIEPYPGAVDAAGQTMTYSFSIRDAAGSALIEEDGTVGTGSGVQGAAPSGPPVLRLRFRELTMPAGRWEVRLDAGEAAGLVRDAELRLRPPAAGLMPALMTTLVLAALGWLTASLGALHWIRSEAARPGAHARGAVDDGRARVWAVGCHLSALLGYLVPFGHLLGPLAIWLAKRDVLPGVEAAGRSVLNFQLSITLYVLASLLLSFFLIGVAVLFVLVVFHFTMVLYASLRAQRGLDVNYPLTIRFI